MLDAGLLQDLETTALGWPGVVLDIKWRGVRVLQIEGKMFATLSAQALSCKVADDDFLPLCGLPGVRPAPYLARARWIQVHTLDSHTPAQLQDRLATARHIVLGKLPKTTRARYGA